MASFRKLPSGKWQASVNVPVKGESGRSVRRTKTHALKRVVVDWATQFEGAIGAGAWQDPRQSTMTLREYRDKWRASHISDQSTVRKTDSQWRSHIEPTWGGYPLSAIVRSELKTWVHRMHAEECARCRRFPGLSGAGKLVKHKNSNGNHCSGSGDDPGLGAWTIQGAASHLSGLLSSAVEEGLLPANPAARLRLPVARPKTIFYWTRDEAALIGLELQGSDALAVDLAMHVGFRPGELFGLRKPFVDTFAWLINIEGVNTRDGWRAHAKTSRSHRAVPVPHHLRSRLDQHLAGIEPNGIVFPAPDGGFWNDRNFAQRVFVPALKRAGVRPGTPYDMRHTAASWLVQLGVDLLRVQELLGHEKYSTTQRYSHLKPGEFTAVLDAWGSVPPLDIRTEVPTARGPHERI